MVFLTAFDQYAIQAFDEGAVGYLLKPLDRARLARTVQRVKERLSSPPANLAGLVTRLQGGQAVGPLRWITVQRGRELQLITVDDVCYFRADHKYVAVVTAHSEALISMPLKELVQRLEDRSTCSVRRCTSSIVNVHAIKAVARSLTGKLVIQLKQRSETLEVSESFAHRFKQL